ncbi:sperm flagellar protein 2-like [Tubulanus polymorphus]|uniref:sperm flagellar protein 2-like n=1 Tax=Tubulanus polymorphus TaxID=672921 RepID=UPI003DA44AB9
MSDILCDWLNNELDLSQKVDQNSFAKDFSNGYLIGEVLNKYQLQHDFDQFSQSYSADSKLNNFTRIEPTLNLLMIPFDTNLAREIMTQTHGVVTRLMYQLFIALNNKKKSNLTGIAMETMRAAAPVKLEAVESIMYQDRLKQKTPRQTDLNLDALVAKFHEKQVTLETNAFKQRFLEQERLRDKHQSERQALIERAKYLKQKQKDLLAKIDGEFMPDAATVDIPKTPPHRGRQALLRQKQLHTKKVTEETMRSIWEFEEKMKSVIEPSKPLGPEDFHREVTETELTAAAAAAGAASPTKSQKSELDLIKPASNDEYIGKIRKRLQEDSAAREEREKRRRKVLVDQLKAHEYQEEARREEMLVNRLMRQSQQERRIAVQLLQARHEKEAIRNNRIYREQQYEQRRARDFNDALDKEAQMAKIAKLEYEEQTKKDKILHDKISEDRQIAKYNKHYNQCRQVLNQIVDLTCKTVEYRQLTDNLIPEKLWRDWTTLFLEGKSLYENEAEIKGLEDFTPQEILEEERQQLLDETDFKEYKEMVGEWSAPESSEISGPPRDNPIVGYVVKRLYEMVHPASPPAAAPQFPEFPIKACILGKAFSGKTSCIRALMNNKRVQLLNADDLVVMAINAHRNDEVEEIPVPEFEEENLPVTAGSTTPGATTTPAPTSPGANTPAPGVNAPTAAVELTDAPVEDVAAAAPTDSNKITEEQSEIGAEKSDPEKPVVEDESQSELSSSYLSKSESPVKTQPTERAKLGLKASKCLKKGKPVDDEIVVDILVEAIRRIPEGTGWILDGYPTTYSQAKLVEKALSGFDTGVSNEILTGAGVGGRRVSRIGKKSIIAPDPRPAPPIPDPVSGLNVVILLNVEDEICLKRSAGRMYATQSEEVYQQEFKPPPEGSMTGINKQEKVKPVSDEAHDQEQLQHRMTSFADNWPKLEKWFNKFGTLRIVEGTLNEEAVYLETEKILEDTLAQLEGGKTEEESNPVEQSEITIEEQKPVETVEKPVEIAEVPSAAAADQPQTSRPASKKSRTGSRSGSAKGSPSRNKSPNKSKSRESSGKRSGGSGKEKSSPKGSAKRGRSGKKSKTPEPIEPIEPLEPLEPAGPPPPQPGSQQWTFVDLPIEPELASVLATNWDAIETTYLSNSKVVFRNVREERENVIRYFYQIK